MKKSKNIAGYAWIFFILLSFIPGGAGALADPPAKTADPETAKLVSGLRWLGHSSFRLEKDGQIIYLDPFRLRTDAPKADLILITHDHLDHLSPADVAKIRQPGTVIVTIAEAAGKLPGNIRIIAPGERLTVRGIAIRAVPAYNTDKFRTPGVPYHPKEAGHVGYVITVGGTSLYHAGDTDFIEEMRDLKPDIALLPVSGTYVMTVDEAVQAARAINPRVAVPMHVGGPAGSLGQAREFQAKAAVPVIVLPVEQ